MNRRQMRLVLACACLAALTSPALAAGPAENARPARNAQAAAQAEGAPEASPLQDALGEPVAPASLQPVARRIAPDPAGERLPKDATARLEWTALGVLMLLFIVAVYQLRAQFDDDSDEE